MQQPTDSIVHAADGEARNASTRDRRAARALVVEFTVVCAAIIVSYWPDGLWEDGYFFLRYARNTWTHGVMAWNIADGPVHGMTSQLYQLFTIILYRVATGYFVTMTKL